MGKSGRGRGSSSSLRGGGQHHNSGRIRKSASPNPKRPAIVITAADKNKLSPNNVAPGGSITTRSTANAEKQQQQQQQQSGGGSSTNNSGTSTPAVPVSNDFDILSDSDNGEEGDDKKQSSTSKDGQKKPVKKEKRYPPITIIDFSAGNIDKALMDGGCEFSMRILKTSVKIYTFGRLMFEKVMETLGKAKIPYYTHETPDQAAVKIVLSGYNVPSTPEELKETLKEHRVNPREAKVLSKKTTVTGNHYLWLLYFDRGSTKLQDLRKIKALDGFLVGWRFFTKRSTDAAQCHRCQRFGHGSRLCTLPPKCVKCGDAHLTERCSLPQKTVLSLDKNAEQRKEKVKCANCQGNHTANYRGCSTRKSYLEALEKQRKPATQQPQKTSTGRTMTGSPNPPGFGRTYANVAASGNDSTPGGSGEGGLFTLTEFLSLARDMFSRLSSCQSKLEQFLALQELMGKYLGTAQV